VSCQVKWPSGQVLVFCMGWLPGQGGFLCADSAEISPHE